MRIIELDMKEEVIKIKLKKGEYGKDSVYFKIINYKELEENEVLKIDVYMTPYTGFTINTIKQGELYLATIRKKLTEEISEKKAFVIIENNIEDTRNDRFAKIIIEE